MVNHLVTCNGKFFFSPNRQGLKKTHRSFDNAVILKVDNGITEFYSSMLFKKYGLVLSKPAWGTHVTVVSDKDRVRDAETFNRLKDEFNETKIKLKYDVRFYKQFQFWVLNIQPTPELIKIRQTLGLRADYPFHITIGRDDV